MLYGIGTHDVTTGMFGFRRQAAHAIAWETNYSFPAEIIIRSHLAGLRYKEVPISYLLTGRRGDAASLAERQGVLAMFPQVPLRFENAGGEAMTEYLQRPGGRPAGDDRSPKRRNHPPCR